MRSISLAVRQVPYEQKSYWRNPVSAFFTFAFPIMFLVIFASLNTGDAVDFLGGLKYNQYYIPSIISFGVMSACYTNIALTLSVRRDSGILKRLKGTPLPASSLIGGLLGSTAVVAALLVALTAIIGIAFYGVTFPGHWLALAIALLTGAICFCSIGIAVSSMIPNAAAAPAIVNGVFLPIVFLSGVFFPLPPDSTLSHIANFFPVRPFVLAVFSAFDPRTPAGLTHGFAWKEVGVLCLWAVAATVIAIRTFRWEPKK